MNAIEQPTDRDTWQALRAALLRFVRARVEDDATAEDIVHDVLLRGFSRGPDLHDGDRLQAWLYRVARNAVIDHYRTRKPMAELPADLAVETPDTDVIEELAGCMLPCMDRLPEDYRSAIVMSEIEGLTLRETGTRLGLSLSGAKSRVQRGRAKLLDLMQACCAFERDSRGNVMDRTPLAPTGCTCGCDHA
jgi:RNA polymerase sigma-70 factor (ECF subfamily)